MRLYRIGLSVGTESAGFVEISTVAESLSAAIDQVVKAENAPYSAVLWARATPTPKEVRKTKSMLRGI